MGCMVARRWPDHLMQVMSKLNIEENERLQLYALLAVGDKTREFIIKERLGTEKFNHALQTVLKLGPSEHFLGSSLHTRAPIDGE